MKPQRGSGLVEDPNWSVLVAKYFLSESRVKIMVWYVLKRLIDRSTHPDFNSLIEQGVGSVLPWVDPDNKFITSRDLKHVGAGLAQIPKMSTNEREVILTLLRELKVYLGIEQLLETGVVEALLKTFPGSFQMDSPVNLDIRGQYAFPMGIVSAIVAEYFKSRGVACEISLPATDDPDSFWIRYVANIPSKPNIRLIFMRVETAHGFYLVCRHLPD
jgi:hypothetical protein